MTIINMVGGGGTSGPKVPLNAISVISAVGGDTEATITWTDPSDLVVNGVTVTTWTATKLVRKAGSAPVDSTDGILVVTETVRDDYSVTGYTDTGLTNGTTYYYAAFAVGDNGLETISSTIPDVTPESGRLPAEYQEVEWIGGTNSNSVPQVYINTGITTSNNIGAWTEMLHTATRDNLQWFTNTLPNNTVRWGLTTYPSGKWCPQWETWRQTNIAYSTNQFYDIKLNWNNNKKCDIDGTTIYNCTNTTFSSNNTIRIGDIEYNGYGWKCKFFKISDGTTLVRDLVPCYRKLDSVIGMYDTVNNVFYTNSGTGTFTKGPDVN